MNYFGFEIISFIVKFSFKVA